MDEIVCIRAGVRFSSVHFIPEIALPTQCFPLYHCASPSMHRSSHWIDNIILWTLIILIRDQTLCDSNEMSQIRFYFSWAYELLDSTSGGRFPWQNFAGILCYEVNYNRVNSIGVMTNANRVVPNQAHLAQLEVRTHTVKKREERRACPWACHSAQTDYRTIPFIKQAIKSAR